MVFTFLENALNICIFTHAPVPHSKLQAEFFESCFLQDERGGENYDLFIFCMIYNFSKCDGFTVL